MRLRQAPDTLREDAAARLQRTPAAAPGRRPGLHLHVARAAL